MINWFDHEFGRWGSFWFFIGSLILAMMGWGSLLSGMETNSHWTAAGYLLATAGLSICLLVSGASITALLAFLLSWGKKPQQ